MYIYKEIPKRAHGFNFAQLAIIADTILKEVNKSGADLMLNKQHRKDIIRFIDRGRYEEPVKCVRAGYDKYIEPWETRKISSFFGTDIIKPGTIEIKINSFKLEVVKSAYAIRGLFKKLNIEILEV